MQAQMTELVQTINNLALVVDTRIPIPSKRGSDLKDSDLSERFTFVQVPIFDMVWPRSDISSLIVLQCYWRVFRFAAKMARQSRRGAVLEVEFIQPATRFLLNQFCSLILGNDAVVRNEVSYKSHAGHIHGRMDCGVFRPSSNACFLSNEDKRSDKPLSPADICQAAGEMSGCIEVLRGLPLNPLIFNSLLNSGREWVLLRRILHESQPLWHYTSSLYLFDQGGNVDMDSVYLLTQMLLHCFSNARDLVGLSKVPAVIGYGTIDDVDTVDDADDENKEEEEEKKSDCEPTEKFATVSRRTAKSKSSGKNGLKSKGQSKTRKFGASLTIENMMLRDAASKMELFSNWI